MTAKSLKNGIVEYVRDNVLGEFSIMLILAKMEVLRQYKRHTIEHD